jgi:hypothetical protein
MKTSIPVHHPATYWTPRNNVERIAPVVGNAGLEELRSGSRAMLQWEKSFLETDGLDGHAGQHRSAHESDERICPGSSSQGRAVAVGGRRN